jgi:glucose dehydrogenase
VKSMQWIAMAAFIAVLPVTTVGQTDWPTYGHDPGGMRYSPLKQITPANVAKLTPVWMYDTGEVASSYQVTPLVVGNVMYLSTPNQRLVALNADTGKEIWAYDPATSRPGTHRGVSYWPGDSKNGPRIVFSTGDSRLLELDAETGKPVATFGRNGEVDLKVGVADKYPGAMYYLSSPPAIYHDLIIFGPRLEEGAPNGKGPSGEIRAFNALTGALVWSFHTLPRPGEPGYDTWGPDAWKDGAGPSAWAGITVDAARGLVFVPTGNPTGGGSVADRAGNELYSSSLLALDANTGKLKWYFQSVHHDLWDFDDPAPPALIEVKQGHRTIPAVAQMTKQGMLFILDRMTGQPIFGVEERPVPIGTEGDGTSPTQPFPIKPPPLSRDSMGLDEVSKMSPEAEAYCTAAMGGHALVPYSRTGPSFPSSIGGGNWGGVAFDPSLGLIFANTSELGRAPGGGRGFGRGSERGAMRGAGPAQATGEAGASVTPTTASNRPNSNRFVDPDYYPCNQPPWGLLTAVNANTGDIVWRVPLGSYKELEAKGIKNTGTPNLGGAIATAGGLLFIGATNDQRFRAFDSKTGKELWTEDINGNAMSVPITYQSSGGRQFVVVATGGDGLLGGVGPRHTPPTQYKGMIVAFALPAKLR